MATALRYFDLVLLVVALPVFIAADLPMAGYVAVAAPGSSLHAIELGADRAVARADRAGDRRAAMGWIAATTLARAWVVTLAVLLVGCSRARTPASRPRSWRRSSSPFTSVPAC